MLNEMSYANIQLYCASLPTYNTNKDDDNEVVNADDPSNKDKLKKLFN